MNGPEAVELIDNMASEGKTRHEILQFFADPAQRFDSSDAAPRELILKRVGEILSGIYQLTRDGDHL